MRTDLQFIPASLLVFIACTGSRESSPADSAAAAAPPMESEAAARSDTKPMPRLFVMSRCDTYPRPKGCPPIRRDDCLALAKTQRGDTHPSPALRRRRDMDSAVAITDSVFRLMVASCPPSIREQMQSDTKPTPR
jgi:hypothetical protein